MFSGLCRAYGNSGIGAPQGWRCIVLLMVISGESGSAPAADPATLSHAYSGSRVDYVVRRGDTLSSLSARFGQGSADLLQQNGLRPDAGPQEGHTVHLDNRHIVPRWLDRAILSNVPQRMLFRFENNQLTAAYPVGLGKRDWPTPTGRSSIVSLQEDKTWFVPESIQEEMRRNGLDVKTSIPPGPDNPLGKHWIGSSEPGIGMHGTIAPVSIYGFPSHGCIRLHPYDAQRLYGQASLGEAVAIVYEPALLARFVDGRIHVEVHRDAYRKDVDALATLKRLADEQGLAPRIDWRKVKVAVSQKAGAMRDVTLKPLPMNGSGK